MVILRQRAGLPEVGGSHSPESGRARHVYDSATLKMDSSNPNGAQNDQDRPKDSVGLGKPKTRSSPKPQFRKEVQVKAWVPKELREAIGRAARRSGLTQEDWIVTQLYKGLEIETPLIAKRSEPKSLIFAGLSGPSRTKKSPVTLRLEPTLEEAMRESVREAGVKQNDWIRAAIVSALQAGLDVQAILEPAAGEESDFS